MVDTTIIAGCACVAAAFGYFLLGKFGAILALAGMGYLYFKYVSKPSKNPAYYKAFCCTPSCSGTALDDFKEWLQQVDGFPSAWVNTVVFCVAHLAEQLTGFRPQDHGINQFPSQSGVTTGSIVDYIRDAKHGWLDGYCNQHCLHNTCICACPGIGDASAKALAKVGIYTTRDLIKKFNSFSGLSIKPEYN